MEQLFAEKILANNKKIYNLLAEEFSATRNQNWPEVNKLIKYVKKGDKILDLGCGNGRLYKILKNNGVEYTGIDISKKLIEIARKNYPKARFIVADALNLPFKEKEFDLVFAIALLHHIPTENLQLRVLKNCFKILKKNGLIILTVWNLIQPRLLLKYKICPFSKDVYVPWKSKILQSPRGDGGAKTSKILKRYYHVFTKGELKQIVKKAGFKIIKCYFARDNLIAIAKKL